jgi:prevent-host-death family protein
MKIASVFFIACVIDALASFLKQVQETKRPLVITQHGKGAAVLLDVGEFEAMQEKLELLQDIQTSPTGKEKK